MQAVRLLLGVVYAVIALGLMLHFLLDGFYADVVDIGQVWFIMDAFIAFGMTGAVVTAAIRKLGQSGERWAFRSVTREYISASAAFYGSLALALAFASNYLNIFSGGRDNQSDNRILLWLITNPLYVVAIGYTGYYLLFRSRPAEARPTRSRR